MTHLTDAAIRESLKSKGLGDDKVDIKEFGEILKFVPLSQSFHALVSWQLSSVLQSGAECQR